MHSSGPEGRNRTISAESKYIGAGERGKETRRIFGCGGASEDPILSSILMDSQKAKYSHFRPGVKHVILLNSIVIGVR